jgi:acetolactate synthase-1/2/3 large subunit
VAQSSVAQLIAAALAEAGVKWAFTVPGESFLPLLDALPAAGIKVVGTRHEAGAAFMAEAVGQLTGRPAAVLGTRAVGAANMSIGIHTARQNSTPMVALVGQVKRRYLGREAFQEADLVESFGRLAKWAGQIDQPERAVALVGESLSSMLSNRPGPVLLSVPEDVLDASVPDDDGGGRVTIDHARPQPPDPVMLQQIVDLLTGAQRPAILAGGGVIAAGARPALMRFSEQVEVPVFAAWRRPTAFPNDHPHYLGMTGYGAPATVLPRLRDADVLLVLGCRLSEVATFDYRVPGRSTHWVHVDLEPRRTYIRGRRAASVALAADARDFLDLGAERTAGYRAPQQRVEQLALDRQAYLEASTLDEAVEWRGPGVHPGRIIATLQRTLTPNAILTTDAGNFGLWAARFFRFGGQAGFLGPTSGAMGYGLPAAVAASLCEPDRQVVALCGDGGVAMTMNELETAVRAGAKPVVLVFDNRRYGTIAMHQDDEGRDTIATELGPIDFAAVARACGAQGGRVGRDVEFEPALRDALAADRPALLHIEIDPRWISPDRFDARRP